MKKKRQLPGRFSGPPWHPQGPFLGRFRGPDSAPFAVPIVAPSRSGLRSETWSVRGPHQGGSRQETRPDQARPTQADQAETKPTRQGQGDKAKETKPARPKKTRGSDKAKEWRVYPVRQILALRNCDAKFSRFEKLSRNTTKSFRAQTVQILPNTL